MISLRDVLLVGAGGFVGASLRYLMSGLVQRLDPASTFPYGTLAVNVAGCLAIGAILGLADGRQQTLAPGVRLVIVLGVLGGFTTFSTFASETLILVRGGEGLKAAMNVFASVAACLIGVWLGYGLAARG